MPRKINKRKLTQKAKRKAGLAPPPRASIYDRPAARRRLIQFDPFAFVTELAADLPDVGSRRTKW